MYIAKEQTIDGFVYSTDRARLDVSYVHRMLSSKSYWAHNVPQEIVQRSIDHSQCFAVYEGDRQVGFARVITDYATFGYLADVFIDEDYRGRGLSKNLMAFIFSSREFNMIRRLMLITRDAHTLYQRYGFNAPAKPENYMELHRPDVYKNLNVSP
jgi:N-acetylglutamate synthase-like GNAT family acetyltransferase